MSVDGDDGQDRFRRFLKVFEDIARTSENGVRVATKQVELTNRMIDALNAVFEVIGHEKQGAISAIDDLIAEVQALRQDLRAFSKAAGVQVSLGPLFGGKGRR